MSRMTYAVRWREGSGETFAGRVVLRADELELTGTAVDGTTVHRALSYADVHRLFLDRSARGAERPSLVLVTGGGALTAIESLESLGVLHELADRIARARFEVLV